jgi:tetratricopeptide (TPR) repeat protein
MTAPATMTNCPTDETLAAFLDDRLDSEARQKVIEHVAACADCRDVVMASGEWQAEQDATRVAVHSARPRPWRWAPLAAAAAVATLVFVMWEPVARWNDERGSGIPALAAAANALDERPVEGRLTGGFAFKPLKRNLRGTNSEDLAIVRVQAAAARAGEAAKRNPSPETLHALGISHLLLRHHDEAIEALQEALTAETEVDELGEAIRKSDDAALLSDLAAAYQARGRFRGNPADFDVALDAAERAWELARTPEAAWNRALALDSLNLTREAVDSWKDYLTIDSTTEWAEHARARIADLGVPTQTEGSEHSKATLFASASEGQEDIVERIVQLIRLADSSLRVSAARSSLVVIV